MLQPHGLTYVRLLCAKPGCMSSVSGAYLPVGVRKPLPQGASRPKTDEGDLLSTGFGPMVCRMVEKERRSECRDVDREEARDREPIPVDLHKLRPAHARLASYGGGVDVVTTQKLRTVIVSMWYPRFANAPWRRREPQVALSSAMRTTNCSISGATRGRPGCLPGIGRSPSRTTRRRYQRWRVSGVAIVATSLRRVRLIGCANTARRRRSASVRQATLQPGYLSTGEARVHRPHSRR
jgi:hypothetical protein